MKNSNTSKHSSSITLFSTFRSRYLPIQSTSHFLFVLLVVIVILPRYTFSLTVNRNQNSGLKSLYWKKIEHNFQAEEQYDLTFVKQGKSRGNSKLYSLISPRTAFSFRRLFSLHDLTSFPLHQKSRGLKPLFLSVSSFSNYHCFIKSVPSTQTQTTREQFETKYKYIDGKKISSSFSPLYSFRNSFFNKFTEQKQTPHRIRSIYNYKKVSMMTENNSNNDLEPSTNGDERFIHGKQDDITSSSYKLNTDDFSKKITTLALALPLPLIGQALKQFSPYILKIPKMKSVVKLTLEDVAENYQSNSILFENYEDMRLLLLDYAAIRDTDVATKKKHSIEEIKGADFFVDNSESIHTLVANQDFAALPSTLQAFISSYNQSISLNEEDKEISLKEEDESHKSNQNKEEKKTKGTQEGNKVSKQKSNYKHLPIQLTAYDLILGFDFFTVEQLLSQILPSSLTDIPTSFETAGHIAHLNLRENMLPYKYIIAQVILAKNKSIRSVVNKISSIATEYRTFPLELLAGEKNYEVTLKESGAKFTFDFSEVYWNSRLQSEHLRIINLIQPGEVVWDMMAGVGPFAVPLAMKNVTVYANDLNPKSYEYLVKNAKANKCTYLTSSSSEGNKVVNFFTENLSSGKEQQESKSSTEKTKSTPQSGNTNPSQGEKVNKNFIEIFNLCGRDFVRLMTERLENSESIEHSRSIYPNHILMNLPASALEFLDVFGKINDKGINGEENDDHDISGSGRSHVKDYSTDCGERIARWWIDNDNDSLTKTKKKAKMTTDIDTAKKEKESGEKKDSNGLVLNLSPDASNKICYIHCYCFSKGAEDPVQDVIERASQYLGWPLESSSCLVHHVRDVAPKKPMLCLSFPLSKETIFQLASVSNESENNPHKRKL